MQYYLTVRQNMEYNPNYIKNPENGLLKPTGCFWATNYNFNYKDYKEWIDFLVSNPYLLFSKQSEDAFSKNCFIFTLKENAKILTINNRQSLEFLIKNFKNKNGQIDFVSLSKYFDGFYIDLSGLINDDINDELKDKIQSYGVSSLVLFNTDCIDYYYEAKVNIEPFDYEFLSYEQTSYTIDSDKSKKYLK